MRPLHSIKNQYPGINAHLHSYWQGRRGWSRFHTNPIADLLRALRPALLPRGSDADIEPALQIRRLDDAEPPRFPESDLTIYDLDRDRAARPGESQSRAGVAELVMPLAEGLFGEPLSANDYGVLKIYEAVPGRLDRGAPIARIELLSPSNKPGGCDTRDYFDKRLSVIESGIAFIEIDYLHESPTTLRGVPGYSTRRGGPPYDRAHAYRIAISDPRPDFGRGTLRVSDFDVDAPLPIVALPLSGDETLPSTSARRIVRCSRKLFTGCNWSITARCPMASTATVPPTNAGSPPGCSPSPKRRPDTIWKPAPSRYASFR